ncbi:hypothetical protein DFQ26_002615 [Actinomortierella ambigua]|nr:hypothetical protein DFQ26_002615 [Actinomortierella ambigua]
MNLAADPCDDFYEYVCGGFLKHKQIPPGELAVSTIQSDRSDHIARQILEANPKNLKGINGKALDATSLRNLNKIQAVYKMCMDETQLESVGAKPLVDELQQLVTTIFPVQGSPLSQAFTSNPSNPPASTSLDRALLTSALSHFAKAGIAAFFTLSSVADPVNDLSVQRVFIEPAGPTLPSREAYGMKVTVNTLEDAIQKTISLVLGNHNKVEAEKLAKDIVAFETQLANISDTAVERSSINNMFTSWTTDRLDQINPAIDWNTLLEKSLGHTGENDAPIIVNSPAYLEKLGKLLIRTSPATLQTFFAWKVMASKSARLSAKYRTPLENLDAAIGGKDPSRPPQRWKSCVTSINAGMGPLVGYFYVGLMFKEADRKTMVDIIDAMKDSYRVGFPHLNWLDNKTLANALHKLDAIKPIVGWSAADPNIGSSTYLERYFADIKINKDDYFGANLARAGKKTQRQRMILDPQVINAAYHPTGNQIHFPAAFVQPPMYRAGAPEYLNFGGIGFVVGHEITHGFDANGRQFDSKGFLRDWWGKDTVTRFNANAQCIIDQYSSFTVRIPSTNVTHRVNGLRTISENIADLGGVKYAFRTWLSRYNADRSGQRLNNQLLPGMERFTRDQLFFVAYGQLSCTKLTPKMEEVSLTTGFHAPDKWRVNGPLQNLPAFVKAFKCPLRSQMNPDRKCTMW